MAKPVSAKDGMHRRLDVVLDLNMNEDRADPEHADSWMSRHVVVPRKKPTTTTKENDQKS